jgi:glutaminyl-peptide cyclotransferase
MRSKIAIIIIGLAVVAMLFRGFSTCTNGISIGKSDSKGPLKPMPSPFPEGNVPDFNADSAYTFVKKQVDFGPRVPNTSAHKKCAAWLVGKFKGYGLNVIEQRFTAPHYKGGTFDCVNIIAQYKPEAVRRILVMSHWDSRFMAENDTRDTLKPVDGADDGASGVAVLLEIARLTASLPPGVGVDLICIDGEDQGDNGGASETWCLGAQYWAKNLHRPNYMPFYAILLDMVGAKGARFLKEGGSMEIAPSTVDRIWNLAGSLNYSNYFINTTGPGITDDHVFVYRNARIPMLDIISMPNDGRHPFGDHHHKHSDNMDVIDRETLKAVGQVMAAVIWRTPVVQ